jgi:hypothetical protein
MNTNLASPGLFFKDSNGDLVKTGPVHVGTTAPNATPASGGQAGNSKGELWLDTTGSDYTLKTWDGSAWREIVVTSTMIKDGTIVNADINASAAIVDTKLATIATAGKVSNSATTATNANTASAIVARDASGNFSAGTVTADLTGTASAIADNTVTNVKVASNAAIAGTKISPDFGSQALTTTGLISANGKVSFPLGTAALPSLYPGTDTDTGIYSPGANQVGISTNGVERVKLGTSEVVFNDDGANYNFRIEGDTNPNLLRVDAANDRVGLGTSIPSTLLSIGAGTVSNRTAIGGSSLSLLAGGYDSTGAGSSIELGNGHGNDGDTASWIMQSVVVAGSGVTRNNHLTFSTRTAFGNVVTERLRITPAGRVGIGTTGPGAQLEINGGVSRTDYWTPAGKYSAKLGLVTGTDTDIYAGITGSYQAGTSANLILQARFSDIGTVNGVVLKNSSSNSGGLAICSLTGTGGGAVETERARIDGSGRLLVGTSTARSNIFSSATPHLQLEGTDANNSRLSLVRNVNSLAAPALVLGKTRGASIGSNAIVFSGDNLGGLEFVGADGTNFIEAASIYAAVDGTPGANDMPGRLVFSTTADGSSSPTERMRITNAGTIEFGGARVTAGGGIVFDPITNDRMLAVFRTTLATSNNLVQFVNPNGVVGTIATNGTATAYNTSSDYRLKENVVSLTGAIDRLNDLQVHRFNFIADPDTVVDGFIAHEAQAIVPECVTGEKDEVDADGNPVYQGIDQSKLVPLLTAALQEAIGRIETLEAEVAALKGV